MNKPHAISGNGCHDSWSLLVSHFVAHLRYDALSYPSAIKSVFSLILFNIPSKYLHQTGFWLTISHYHRVYFYHLQPVVIDQSWVESPVLPSVLSANFPWKVELSGEPYWRHPARGPETRIHSNTWNKGVRSKTLRLYEVWACKEESHSLLRFLKFVPSLPFDSYVTHKVSPKIVEPF